jgi:hypothetical protein
LRLLSIFLQRGEPALFPGFFNAFSTHFQYNHRISGIAVSRFVSHFDA